jgi:hypothetical protein
VTPTVYRILADAVLYLHAGFVLFVVAGLLLVLAGGTLGWRWVRNRRFRILHLIAIGVVVLQAWLGVLCPLTRIEVVLRARAGEAVYSGSFIAYWVERLLYYDAPPWVFSSLYTVFGVLVIASWLWVRPQPVSEP